MSCGAALYYWSCWCSRKNRWWSSLWSWWRCLDSQLSVCCAASQVNGSGALWNGSGWLISLVRLSLIWSDKCCAGSCKNAYCAWFSWETKVKVVSDKSCSVRPLHCALFEVRCAVNKKNSFVPYNKFSLHCKISRISSDGSNLPLAPYLTILSVLHI